MGVCLVSRKKRGKKEVFCLESFGPDRDDSPRPTGVVIGCWGDLEVLRESGTSNVNYVFPYTREGGRLENRPLRYRCVGTLRYRGAKVLGGTGVLRN